MIVGTLRIATYLPGVHSLKEKRKIVRGIKDRIRSKFNVSIAESDHQDVWQSAEFGVAAVSNETSHLHSILDNVLKTIRFSGEIQITHTEREIF